MATSEDFDMATDRGSSLLSEAFSTIRYGYEHTFSEADRKLFASLNTHTAKLVRYGPDQLLVPNRQPALAALIEYKASATPLHSLNRIAEVQASASDRGHHRPVRESIGQVEAAAFDTYVGLASIGVRVAVFMYCVYHPRKLLAEWAQNIVEIFRSAPRFAPITGSGTPWVNIDLDSMRPMSDFVSQEFHVDPTAVAGATRNLLNGLEG